MSMTIQPIKNDQGVMPTVSNLTPLATTSLLAPLVPYDKQSSSSTDKTANSATAKDVYSGAKTASAKDAANRLTALQHGKDAQTLKAQAASTSKAVEEQMESMKDKMDEIVNSYPPFLRGSEKRQQYLMSISSIRRQIEAMTLPPSKADQVAPDGTASGATKKMWSSLFKNLDIPALEPSGPNEATDAQIKAASAAIGAMQSDLSSRRAALEQQVATPNQISSPVAQYLSQAAGQGLAQTNLSLTTNLTGALKSL